MNWKGHRLTSDPWRPGAWRDKMGELTDLKPRRSEPVRASWTPLADLFPAASARGGRLRDLRIAPGLVIFGLIATTLAFPASAGPLDGQKPAATSPESRQIQTPIPIFLNTPTDRDAFWKLLGRPDLVILDGELYRKLTQAAEPGKPTATPLVAVVEAVAATGGVSGDWARLSLEYQVALETDGPSWVSIQLDGLTLSEVLEGAKDLPTRMTEGRAWQVALRGKGQHLVRVGLLAPVKSTVDGKRLDLAIPPVASTRIDLTVPQTVLDASTGVNEMTAVSAVEGSSASRLSARLSPRSRIELSWREQADPAIQLPALLSAKGEIAIEVEQGSIRTRSSWYVGAIRGSANQLTIRLDPNEEVLDVEVDNRPVQVETRREAGRSVLTIPLSEPLRSNTNRGVILTTRRPIASGGTVLVALQGYSFDEAKVQTGMIAISRVGPLFLNPTPGRGLRRIDPRTELPDNLRNRAETVLAFEFNEQPFELGFSIEPAPPRIRIESRTTITLDPRSARVQTRLDCRTTQGRVFEVKVQLPRGLEFESAQPAELVESAQVVPLDPKASGGVGVDVPRVLSIILTHQARESEAFAILLKGWSAIDPSKLVALPLFQPLAPSTTTGRFAVVTDRNVSADLPLVVEDPSGFRVDWAPPPTDWVWSTRRPAPEQGLLWLRCDANPETLPLRVVVRPRSIRHESTLTASIGRKGVEVVDEIVGEVAFGTLSRLDLAIPVEVGDRWELEGVDKAIREPLEPEADGARRYRLRFARDFTETFRVKIRYRLPFIELPTGDHPGRFRLAPVRVLEGASVGQRVLLAAEPGIELKSDAKGWSTLATADLSALSAVGEGSSPVRLALSRIAEKAEPVGVEVRLGPQFKLPSLVVSRLWIKTVQRLENDQVSTASFWVETREGPMVVALPPGSRWIRALMNSIELGENGVEKVAADEYQLGFPVSTPSGPVLVSIDYVVPGLAGTGAWVPPRLLGGGVVQQTHWEVHLPGTRVGIGLPSGWTGENEWFWDGLVWRRRPSRTEAELSNWLTGGSPRYRVAESLDRVQPAGHPSYLFSRVGPPTTLRFMVLSRFTLLLLCSGPVLLAGLLILARRPPPRWIASSLLMLVFVAGVSIELNVVFVILQSAALGIVLLVLALGIHRVIERRSRGRSAGNRALIVGSSSVGSTPGRESGVGSDDSTEIRVRQATPSAVSTTDHIVLTRTPGRPLEERPAADLDVR